MSYPVVYRAIIGMAPKALLSRRWAAAIARKAGLKNGALIDGGADIAGTFSRRNVENGYSLSAGTLEGSGRAHDVTGLAEARVLVNVAEAGTGTFGVLGDIAASVSLSAEGIAVSDWEPIEGSAWSWVSTGSAVIGLAQLEVR